MRTAESRWFVVSSLPLMHFPFFFEVALFIYTRPTWGVASKFSNNSRNTCAIVLNGFGPAVSPLLCLCGKSAEWPKWFLLVYFRLVNHWIGYIFQSLPLWRSAVGFMKRQMLVPAQACCYYQILMDVETVRTMPTSAISATRSSIQYVGYSHGGQSVKTLHPCCLQFIGLETLEPKHWHWQKVVECANRPTR